MPPEAGEFLGSELASVRAVNSTRDKLWREACRNTIRVSHDKTGVPISCDVFVAAILDPFCRAKLWTLGLASVLRWPRAGRSSLLEVEAFFMPHMLGKYSSQVVP